MPSHCRGCPVPHNHRRVTQRLGRPAGQTDRSHQRAGALCHHSPFVPAGRLLDKGELPGGHAKHAVVPSGQQRMEWHWLQVGVQNRGGGVECVSIARLICSFGIGGDGNIYEGRGFTVEGAHAPRYNNRSIGICVIGDWSSECIGTCSRRKLMRLKRCFFFFTPFTADLPTPAMLYAVQQIIKIGIGHGHVQANYTLLGHRQTRPTECPGDRLFKEITTWPHFVALPTVADVEPTTVPPPAETTTQPPTASVDTWWCSENWSIGKAIKMTEPCQRI